MQAKDDISNELRLLRFPVMDRSLLQYQVPDEYFDTFPGQILQLVKKQQEAVSNHSFDSDRKNLDSMTGESDLSRQKYAPPKPFSTLPGRLNAALPYSVPLNYFSEFPLNLQRRIRSEDQLMRSTEAAGSNLLDIIKETSLPLNPFVLKDKNYFENFESHILNTVKETVELQEETEALSPVLTGLKGKNVFEVPEGYFEAEPVKTAIQKPLVVVHPAHRSIRGSSWIAAAAILLIFFLGGRGLFMTNNGTNAAYDQNLEEALSALSEQEITEYLEATMNEYELANLYPDNANWEEMLNEQNQKQLLEDIPIEDIKTFLENGGF